jgi:signal transduction histidine kinase
LTHPSASAAPDQQLRQHARRWPHIVTAVTASALLLLWIAFAEHTSHEHQQTLDAVAQRDANLATAVEHYVVRVLRNARAVHQLLGNQVAQGAADGELKAMLDDRLRANDAFIELAICRPDGRVLTSAPAASRLAPGDCVQLLATARERSEVRVGAPIGPAGALLVPIALPLDRGSELRAGVAVALTPVGTFLGIMRSAVLRDATLVTVSGSNGELVAAWRSALGPVADPAGLAALQPLLRVQHGVAVVDGSRHLVSTRALPAAGLVIHVATAEADALAGFHARRRLYLAVCAGLTLVLLAVYAVLMRLHAQSTRAAQSLLQAQGELQALNAQLDTQVRERTAQLEQAYGDLESFSYTIAHDVRAPLAAIGGFAEALEPVVAGHGNEKQRHYLQRIRANARQMDQLTQHLLDLGRLSRAPLRLQAVDVGAVASEVASQLAEREPHREVQLEVQPELRARADPALLRQLLDNLLGNAWKFTGARSPAVIRVGSSSEGAEDGQRTFFVADNGAGFDSGEAAGLFEPFRRLHSEMEFPGNGVGLATVQRILALHGGRIWCSARPEAGATFSFTLPAP